MSTRESLPLNPRIDLWHPMDVLNTHYGGRDEEVVVGRLPHVCRVVGRRDHGVRTHDVWRHGAGSLGG